MPRSSRTRPVSAAQVRAYARKAQEFADGNAVAKDLRRLLPLKTQAEYEPEGRVNPGGSPSDLVATRGPSGSQPIGVTGRPGRW